MNMSTFECSESPFSGYSLTSSLQQFTYASRSRLLQHWLSNVLPTQQAKQPAAFFTHESIINPDTATQTDVEGQSEKSTPSVDRALVPGVKVLHTDDSEDGVVFVVNWKENGSNDPQL